MNSLEKNNVELAGQNGEMSNESFSREDSRMRTIPENGNISTETEVSRNMQLLRPAMDENWLATELATTKTEMEALKSRLEAATATSVESADVAKAQSLFEEMTKKDEELLLKTQAISQLRTLGRKYKNISAESDAKRKKVEEELNALKKSNDIESADKQKLEAREAALSEEVERLKSQLEFNETHPNNQVEMVTRERDALRERVNELLQAQQQLPEQMPAAVNESYRFHFRYPRNAQLEKENEGMSQDNLSYEANCKDNRCCSDLEEDKKSLATELATTKAEVESLKTRLEEMEATLSSVSSSDFSDVVFDVGGVLIPAHKNILSVRCGYFSKLFSSGPKECATNKVEIEDEDADLFKELLRFIYSGKLPDDLDSKADQYLPIADRYDFEDFKLECASAFGKTLTCYNVEKAVVLAHVHRCPNLTKACSVWSE